MYFDPPRDEGARREFYWFGSKTDDVSGTRTHNNIVSIFWDVLRFVIYKYKLHKTVPNFQAVNRETCFIIKTSLPFIIGATGARAPDPALARLIQALG
jgi:hypothetical protein